MPAGQHDKSQACGTAEGCAVHCRHEERREPAGDANSMALRFLPARGAQAALKGPGLTSGSCREDSTATPWALPGTFECTTHSSLS